MAMAKEMVAGGLSANQAKSINGFVASVSAAGSTISDAKLLGAGHNRVTSVSSGQGVQLPAVEIGDEIFIWNETGTNQLTVYPDSSSNTINQLGAGVGALISPYTGALFKKASTTAWWANLSA